MHPPQAVHTPVSHVCPALHWLQVPPSIPHCAMVSPGETHVVPAKQPPGQAHTAATHVAELALQLLQVAPVLPQR
jgi:hypothetical protein